MALESNTGIQIDSVRKKFMGGYQKVETFCLLHVMKSQFKEKSPPNLKITSRRTNKNELLSHSIFYS